MDSGDEAEAAIDKFHSKELSGRTIRVEFAKSLKKPQPQPPAVQPVKETVYKLYVSNLQWKVRSTDLKEFFSSDFTPVSTRVVFESTPFLRSAGYGFVSFNTREEAEDALTSLDGKELMGRPVRLKFSEQNKDGDATNEGEETNLDESSAVLSETELSEDQSDKS
uniref:RRM domain-containing protein n=2 Tax=Chenopodium quinoa TaxID=63459 RepID=A0A803LU09_CHEQI